MKTSKVLVLIAIMVAMQGCGIFRAAGRSVEAVGEGTGHAVSETGRAIGDATSTGGL